MRSHPRTAAVVVVVIAVLLLVTWSESAGLGSFAGTEAYDDDDSAPVKMVAPVALEFSAVSDAASDVEARDACRKGTRRNAHPGWGESPKVQFIRT